MAGWALGTGYDNRYFKKWMLENYFNFHEPLRVFPENLRQFSSILANIWMLETTYESKEEGKDQESLQLSTTPDQGHHIGKWQKHKKTPHTRQITLKVRKRAKIRNQYNPVPHLTQDKTAKRSNSECDIKNDVNPIISSECWFLYVCW